LSPIKGALNATVPHLAEGVGSSGNMKHGSMSRKQKLSVWIWCKCQLLKI